MCDEHGRIIDGDGHVVEDIATIWKYLPEDYVGKSFSEARGKSPEALGGSPVTIHLQVPDVDATYARALEHGAKIKVVEVSEGSIGVDSKEDLERVKAMLEDRKPRV